MAPAVLVAAMVPPLRGHLLEKGSVEAELILQFVLLRDVGTCKYDIFLSIVGTQFSHRVGKEIIVGVLLNIPF